MVDPWTTPHQVGFFGYVAFCDEDISGDVLMNFRPTFFSELIKFCFVISVATSFPLVIFPCRAAINTLCYSQVCVFAVVIATTPSHWSSAINTLCYSQVCVYAVVMTTWCCLCTNVAMKPPICLFLLRNATCIQYLFYYPRFFNPAKLLCKVF